MGGSQEKVYALWVRGRNRKWSKPTPGIYHFDYAQLRAKEIIRDAETYPDVTEIKLVTFTATSTRVYARKA
jgi:hypothetical protein